MTTAELERLMQEVPNGSPVRWNPLNDRLEEIRGMRDYAEPGPVIVRRIVEIPSEGQL